MKIPIVILLILSGCTSMFCNEEKVQLTGQFDIEYSKYPILVFKTESETIWTYENPEEFKEYFNSTVTINAIKSPANSACNICARTCDTCQCPIDQELLYDIEVVNDKYTK